MASFKKTDEIVVTRHFFEFEDVYLNVFGVEHRLTKAELRVIADGIVTMDLAAKRMTNAGGMGRKDVYVPIDSPESWFIQSVLLHSVGDSYKAREAFRVFMSLASVGCRLAQVLDRLMDAVKPDESFRVDVIEPSSIEPF